MLSAITIPASGSSCSPVNSTHSCISDCIAERFRCAIRATAFSVWAPSIPAWVAVFTAPGSP